MNNNPFIRNDVNYDVWKYELTQYQAILHALNADKSLDPYTKKMVANESLKDIKRFIWYCIGEVYPG